ncbi:hypothetical protein EON80_06545 [bacterium]|nr:MAG: hypothetical protein EON80_06545 [bacterium]
MALDQISLQLEEIHRAATASPQIQLGTGVSPRDVDAAEEILALKFPASMRRFLQSYGTIQLPGPEIYGLYRGVNPAYYDDDCPLIDIVYLALKRRQNFAMNPNWVLLLSCDGDWEFFLDTSANAGGEPPVFYIDIEQPNLKNDYAPDFLDFVLKRIAIHRN